MNIDRLISTYLSDDYKLVDYNDELVSFHSPDGKEHVIVYLFDLLVVKKKVKDD